MTTLNVPCYRFLPTRNVSVDRPEGSKIRFDSTGWSEKATISVICRGGPRTLLFQSSVESKHGRKFVFLLRIELLTAVDSHVPTRPDLARGTKGTKRGAPYYVMQDISVKGQKVSLYHLR